MDDKVRDYSIFMDTSKLSAGEIKALIAHGMPECVDYEGYSYQDMEQMFLDGYRAAVSLIADRINFLTAEIDRETMSVPQADAQIQYWVERSALNALLSRLING